jgi:CheY-like chemotaxis protein
MDGFAKLYEMLESALKQAGEESGMLLGQELAVTLSDALKTNKKSYFGELDDSCFVIDIESREAYPGLFYLVFSLRDAIVLSSTLLGIPPARIQEKKRLSIIEDDDIDAFSEIGNMINGSFNTVFQSSLSNKAHLKILSQKKFIAEVDELTDDEPLPDGEYLMFRSRLEMSGQELSNLDVLIPVALGNLYDPASDKPDEEVVEVDTTAGETASKSDETNERGLPNQENKPVTEEKISGTAGPDSIVVLEDNEIERQQMISAIEFTGFDVVEGTLNADLKELFSNRNVRLVLIGSQDADDRELALCIKINAIRQDAPPPIIMTAERWTRTAVLKALKYGARDIIIKPCGEDELAAKVRRYCKI